MSRDFEWPDAHGPRILLYAGMPAQACSGRCLTPVLIQFVASSGDAGCSKRIFARFSVPRLSDSGYPRMARAIIKAGLDGEKTEFVHWGGCLGH
jgi:hypothetical protein